MTLDELIEALKEKRETLGNVDVNFLRVEGNSGYWQKVTEISVDHGNEEEMMDDSVIIWLKND